MADEYLLEGSEEFDAALTKLIELIADLRPFWPLVVPLFIGWMGRQFDSQGEYFGDHWVPLSEQYAAWKMTHYPGHGLLSAEGDLRKAATTPRRESRPTTLVLRIPPYEKTQRADAYSVKTHRRSRKRIGTGAMIDPDWFQSGTERMPARPLLAEILPEEAQAELSTEAERYINEAARKLGLRTSG